MSSWESFAPTMMTSQRSYDFSSLVSLLPAAPPTEHLFFQLHYQKKSIFCEPAGGAVPSPFDCYLANRGVKTLHLRMREHQKNAFAVARFLETSPHVAEVMYPGLPSHPQHELAKRQCSGFSGMVSFRIKGTLDNALKFLENLKVIVVSFFARLY